MVGEFQKLKKTRTLSHKKNWSCSQSQTANTILPKQRLLQSGKTQKTFIFERSVPSFSRLFL